MDERSLTITERQARALWRQTITWQIGAHLAIDNDEHLSDGEMCDLWYRFKWYFEAVEQAEVAVNVSG